MTKEEIGQGVSQAIKTVARPVKEVVKENFSILSKPIGSVSASEIPDYLY